jgi:hypothetical protein
MSKLGRIQTESYFGRSAVKSISVALTLRGGGLKCLGLGQPACVARYGDAVRLGEGVVSLKRCLLFHRDYHIFFTDRPPIIPRVFRTEHQFL